MPAGDLHVSIILALGTNKLNDESSVRYFTSTNLFEKC